MCARHDPRGRSREPHTCLPDAGAGRPGGCAGGVGGWRGGVALHSRSGPARSVQTLVKSCREPSGDGAGAGTSKAGHEPEGQWVEFAGERSHLILF